MGTQIIKRFTDRFFDDKIRIPRSCDTEKKVYASLRRYTNKPAVKKAYTAVGGPWDGQEILLSPLGATRTFTIRVGKYKGRYAIGQTPPVIPDTPFANVWPRCSCDYCVWEEM